MVKHFKQGKGKVSFGGYIPPNVVAYAEHIRYNHVVWHTPPGTQELLFKEKLGIATAEYPVPGLIWSFGHNLNLFAYIEWKGQETQLYMPPFFNCSGSLVCLGTASEFIGRRQKLTFIQLMNTVETAFWDSEFTHVGDEDNIKGNWAAMYEEAKTTKTFPNDRLKPIKAKLKNIADEIFNSGMDS